MRSPHEASVLECQEWPADGLESVTSCPVCGGGRRELAYAALTDQIFKCAPGKWDLYACERCGSAYLDPRPTPASIGRAYENYYTHSANAAPSTQKDSWVRQWRISQRNGFLNRYYGYQLKPALNFWPLISERRQRRFDRYTGYLRFPGPGARLLDIGCGNGTFLTQMRTLGWDTHGLEPDPEAYNQCQKAGLDVRKEISPEGLWPDGFFDAITLFHVIEHLHDPVNHLAVCSKLLKTGGQLTIATPNYDASGREYFGPDWRGLEVPRHLILFTERSLRTAMENAGFEASRVKRPSLDARNMFRMSAEIHCQRTGKSSHSKLQLRWLAFQADRQTKANPTRVEELILHGTKAG